MVKQQLSSIFKSALWIRDSEYKGIFVLDRCYLNDLLFCKTFTEFILCTRNCDFCAVINIFVIEIPKGYFKHWRVEIKNVATS